MGARAPLIQRNGTSLTRGPGLLRTASLLGAILVPSLLHAGSTEDPPDSHPESLRPAIVQLDTAGWSDYHLRRAVAEIAAGNPEVARGHLEQVSLDPSRFPGADRAAFLLASVYLRLADADALEELATRIASWPEQSIYTQWVQYQFVLLHGNPGWEGTPGGPAAVLPDLEHPEVLAGQLPHLPPEFPSSDVLTAWMLLRSGQPELALTFLGRVSLASRVSLQVLYLRAVAQDRTGRRSEATWRELAGARPRTPLEEDLVSIACIRSATLLLDREGDPTVFLKRVPDSGRYGSRARHMEALWLAESGNHEKAREILQRVFTGDPAYRARREAGLFLAGEALDRRAAGEALALYREVDADWNRAWDEASAWRDSADVSGLWKTWKAGGFWPEMILLDLTRAWQAGEDLAVTARDLGDSGSILPPGSPAEAVRLEPAVAPGILPPTFGELHRLAKLRAEGDRARRNLQRAGSDLTRAEDELRRRRLFRETGLDLVERQLAELDPVARDLHAVLADMDSLLAAMESVKDAATRRFAERSAGLLERAEDHLLWIRTMRHHHVQGPERRRPEPFPPGIPSSGTLLEEEEALLDLIRTVTTAFAEKAPGLLEDSFTRRWVPGARARAARLDSLVRAETAAYRKLDEGIAARIDRLDGGPALAALRDRVRLLEVRVDSLETAYAALRTEIARHAVDRALDGLENEREAVDYGLGAATYEMSLTTLGAGDEASSDSASVALRAESRNRLAAFLEDYPQSPARGEVRFRLADLLLVHAKGEFNRRMARFLDDELPAKGIDNRALVPFADHDPALALYRKILAEDSGFPHQDAVLFNLGMLLSDQSDPEARRHLERLVSDFADSPFCQEAYLRLGNDYFERSRFSASIPYYENATAGDNPGVIAIALYRMGWANISADRFEDAADAFRRLLDHYAAGHEISLKTDLRSEAEDCLIHTMVRGGGAALFSDYFDRIGLRPYESQTLTGMSQVLRGVSLYREAVETDRLYLERYPDNPGALDAARRLVDSYERWNRPGDAREARLLCAERFLPGGRWYSVNTVDSLRNDAEEFSRGAYHSVALHHHHEARKGRGVPENWQRALDLYDLLLDHWPQDDEAGKNHLYAGEAAAHLDLYPEAIMHYESAVARFYAREFSVDQLEGNASDLKYYTVSLPPDIRAQVKEAGWQRLAIIDEWYRTTFTDSSDGLGADTLAAAVRLAAQGFLERHPADPRAADVLWRKANLGFAHGWFEPAAEDYGNLIDAYPQDKRVSRAAALRGDAFYQAGRFDLARHAYEEALPLCEASGLSSLVSRIRPLIPQCAYRHAEETENQYPEDPVRAANLYQEVAVSWPEYEHAGDALYRAGLGFAAGGQADAAVRAWDRLTYRYPEHEYAKDSNLQIAASLETSEDRIRAAEAFERVSRLYPEDPGAGDALLKAADLRTAGGDPEGALKGRLDYVDRFPEDFETNMSILVDLARSQIDSLGDTPISDLVGARTGPTPLARYLELAETHPEFADPGLQARVQFLKGEEARLRYEGIPLTLPIDKSIEVKRKELESLLALYGTCADYGVAEWSRAAAYRIGEALIGFGEALEQSERPAELAGDDLIAYDDVLAGEAWTFYDRGEAVWSDLLRETRDVEDDPGGWIARTRETLWPRLAERFLYMPEVEYPTVTPEMPRPAVPTAPVEKAERQETGAGTGEQHDQDD